MIGSKIAHYEITSHLGSGGMGDVYQATDAKLGRSVAIKVLPEAFARDAHRAARLEREARTLASLNHPNIAAIYGLEESGESKFLVMELAAGETLSERISQGRIPLDEALEIAKQIADALEAAHERGVVHRDLKPAKIKVTPDGQVKVLDFGLAKALEGNTLNSSFSNSPTLHIAATVPGVILGTAGYMSPEQAQGKETDRRTDIFALGCVLYEMLTGSQAFPGESAAQVMARVIERDPDWSVLPSATPPAIRRLLLRCLQKDRNRRLKSADAVRIEIEDALAKTEPAEPVRVPSRKQGLPWMVAAVLVAGLLALAVPATIHLTERRPAAPDEIRSDIVTPPTSDPASFALSPDGRQIAYVATGTGQARLWLRPFNKTAAQPLAGTEGASYPFWSPDGRSIGFFDGSRLKRIDVAGGPPRVLSEAANRGGTWNENGIILYSRNTASPLYRIPAVGGTPMPATRLEKQTSHRFPYFLPDGRHFLFYALGPPESAGVFLGSLDSQDIKRLAASDSAAVYAKGWVLFIRAGTLIAQKLNLEQGTLIGEPEPVADSVAFEASSYGAAISASVAGPVAYRIGGATRRQLTWFDRSGKAIGTLGPPDDSLFSPTLAKDGKRAVAWRTVQANADIWVIDGARMTRLTFEPTLDRFGIWSPDNNKIFFDSSRNGPRNIYEISIDAPGSEKLIIDTDQDKVMNDVTPDGRFGIFNAVNAETGWDLWATPMDGDRKPFIFLKTNFDERRAQFSPDGKWVAYTSTESGQNEVYVRPFREGSGQWQVSTGGGAFTRWASNGNELYYVAPNGAFMAVPISIKGATIVAGTPSALFQARIVGGGTDVNLGIQFDVSRDGRFLVNTLLDDVGAAPITLLQNWNPK